MQTIHLFPEVVGLFNFERNLNKQELSKINFDLQSLDNNGNNKVSKNRSVLEDSDLKELKQFIYDCLNKYLIEVCEEQTQLKITESWLNKTQNGGSHHYHCHPNSYLSGVFYIKTSDDDKITFFNNHSRHNYYQPVVNNWNSFNSKSWWLRAEQNSLLIFRSDLHHSVPETVNDDRISLSFNTFIVGNFGVSENATFLPLSN